MTTFIPANDLETALESARAGRLPMPDFLKVFVASDLAVPSGGEVQSDGGGFQPQRTVDAVPSPDALVTGTFVAMESNAETA